MIKADYYYINNLKKIMEEGCMDQNPRPRYSDGEIAYSKFITQVYEQYDISKGEFPITTLRNTAIKTGIKEILWIYQKQENSKISAHKMGITWWDHWMNKMGNIGRAYSHNLESHRENEMMKMCLYIDPIKINPKYGNIQDVKNVERVVSDIGYISNYDDLNFEQDEIKTLKSLWTGIIETYYKNGKMINKDYGFIHYDWHDFRNFLSDIRYIPQYFLAKEKKFKNWYLSKDYYGSNCYSKDTCVFITFEEVESINEIDSIKKGDKLLRHELSRNQVNDLIHELTHNKFSRRHIISLWNWSNINKKELVECAYETLWSVRNVGDDIYLDMTLIQRSSDYIMANYINKIQYVAFQMMLASHLGYKVGYFSHFVQNLHIYDRHYEAVDEILERTPLDIQPNIKLKENKQFYCFTIDDFIVENVDGIKKLKKNLDIGI